VRDIEDQGGPEPAGRWELLFADLEAAVDEAGRLELADEVADRTRREFGQLRLVDRLRPAIGHRVMVQLPAEGKLSGVLRAIGADWLLLGEGGPRETLIRLAAVCAVGGLGAATDLPGSEGRVGAKLDLRYALRRLARDRAPLAIRLADGSVTHGTCDRVGRDYLELAEHPPGEFRRPAAVRRIVALPLHALIVVRAS
jgi:hypothetical protein